MDNARNFVPNVKKIDIGATLELMNVGDYSTFSNNRTKYQCVWAAARRIENNSDKKFFVTSGMYPDRTYIRRDA